MKVKLSNSGWRDLWLASAAVLAVTLVTWQVWEQTRSGEQASYLFSSGGAVFARARDVKGWLFTCGVHSTRLGRSGDSALLERAQKELHVTSMSGSRHTMISTAEGYVFTCGFNNSAGGGGYGSEPIPDAGQLGRSGTQECAQVILGLEGVRVVMVASGRYHSIALTHDGKVFTWGLNDWGQLGRQGKEGVDEKVCFSGGRCRDGIPAQVTALPSDVMFTHIAAGRYVSGAISDQGRVYTWGHDGCASKGVLPERSSAWKPRLVQGDLQESKVVKIDIGYVFWIALTSEGEVFTCDTGDDGYAGTLPKPRDQNGAGELGREGPTGVPGKVCGELEGKNVINVAAGRDHALAVTLEGDLYSWGKPGGNLGRKGDNRVPKQVPSNDSFTFVGAGEYFSLAATEEKVFGFGANGYEALSTNVSKGDVLTPTPVNGPLSQGDWTILDIKAGYQHSLVLALPKERKMKRKIVSEAIVTAQGVESKSVEEKPSDATPKEESADVDLKPLYNTFESGFDLDAYKKDFKAPHPASYLAGQVTEKLPSVLEALANFKESPLHEEIVANSKDVFDLLPDKYDANLKSPCWLSDGGYRCMPFFQILGVSKCGTTDLYHRLAGHPNIYDSKNKGPHFWDEVIYPSTEPSKSFSVYVDLYSPLAEKVENDRLGISGDASSNTFTGVKMYYRGAGKHLNVTLADLLYEAQPYLRLIVIMRNPVDRYFSAYHYYRDRDKEGTASAEAFHENTVREIKAFTDCVSSRSRETCVETYAPQQLIKGMYSEFVDPWLARFPRKQLLFLRTEDYKVATREHLKTVLKFLDVEVLSDADFDKIVGQEATNKHRVDHEPMLPKTRQLLNSFYAPFNARLARKLNDARYLW